MQPHYVICHLSRKFDVAKSFIMKKNTLSLLSFLIVTSLVAQQPAHSENDGHNHGTAVKPAVVAEDVIK